MNAVDRGASEKTSALSLDRGLYILRYAGSASARGPFVYIRPSYGSEQDVSLVFGPDSPGYLAEPGSAAVLVATATSTIQVTVRSSVPGGSLDAKIEMEAVEKAVRSAPTSPQAEPRAQRAGMSAKRSAPSLSDAIELQGHVSRRGDVTVAVGHWLAGPDDPAQIEAIGLSVKASTDIAVDYQVMVSGDPRWSNWISNGKLAGTRGNARPLIGVRLRLSGADALDYVLNGAALFLGSPTVQQSGLEMEFRSAAGIDPLIGLRIDLQAVAAPVVEPVRPDPVGSATGRVRVFRAGREAATPF